MSRRALRCFAALLFFAVTVRAELPRSPNNWLQLVTDFARNNIEYGEIGPQSALAGVSRRVARGTENLEPAILPLLVLPVPVESKKTPTQECKVSSDSKNQPIQYENYDKPNQQRSYEKSNDGNNFNNFDEDPIKIQWPLPPEGQSKGRPYTTPSYDLISEVESSPVQPFHKVVSSKQLVDWFREQKPRAPYEPPLKLSDFDVSERMPPSLSTISNAPQENKESSVPTSAFLPRRQRVRGRLRNPPHPRFDRPLRLRGRLTVPRADYSEPYTVWWDPASGGARIDYHGGSASTFRSIATGKVYYTETHVDRSGGRAVRRCTVGSPQPAAPEDEALPMLPAELDQFSFAGYVNSSRGEAELWRREVEGAEGQLGGARGEALATRHHLLLARDGGRVVPLSYTVSVNSSVLGTDSDGYYHNYFDVVEEQHSPELFNLDLDETCDQVEQVDASVPEQRARLEPLREFTLPRRDPRYDAKLTEFVARYQRNYQDDTEEAVRKNLIMQSHRFVSSGNREGATAELGVNLFSDRLDAEMEELYGVPPGAAAPGADEFPLSRAEVAAKDLPKEFDWRTLGGVSPVRQQGSCNSCWAFAVTGAVEGVLFKRTKRLVQLSEKYLVDCASTHGGHGCGNTNPSVAYDFIEDKGLPASVEYTPYKPEVEPCKETGPVTRISTSRKVKANDVSALKIAIKDYSPTVVIIDGRCKSFVKYKTGVLYDERCAKAKNELSHAVLAVGWGEEEGVPHFILKNSWGPDWGKEGGYVRVQAPANICGVLTKPSFPQLEEKDVV